MSLESKINIISIYGVNGVGKSTITRFIIRDLVDYESQTTDNLAELYRAFEKKGPSFIIEKSSYSAWELLGKNSPENIINGFKRYREPLKKYLDQVINRAENQKVPMVLEGVHFNPKWNYSSNINLIPVLLIISDRDIHYERILKKSENKLFLRENLTKYFEEIRVIQDFLIKEDNSIIIDTSYLSLEEISDRIKELL